MRAALIGLSICACGGSFAQTAGKLRLLVDPGADYQFVLDHTYKMQQREVELITGPHHFTFWAPDRRMLDTTLMVEQGPTKDVVIRLSFSAEYEAYQSELKHQKRDQWLGIILPCAITAGIGAFTTVNFIRYNNAHNQLGQDQTDYANSVVPSEISDLKSHRIPQDKSDFTGSQTRFFIGAGLFTVAAAGTIWSVVRTLRKPAPSYHDNEKVKFDGLAWMPNSEGGQWLFGAHLALR